MPSLDQALEAWEYDELPDQSLPPHVIKSLLREYQTEQERPRPFDPFRAETGTFIRRRAPIDEIDQQMGAALLEQARDECPAVGFIAHYDPDKKYRENKDDDRKGRRYSDPEKGYAEGVGVGLAGETRAESRFAAGMVRARREDLKSMVGGKEAVGVVRQRSLLGWETKIGDDGAEKFIPWGKKRAVGVKERKVVEWEGDDDEEGRFEGVVVWGEDLVDVEAPKRGKKRKRLVDENVTRRVTRSMTRKEEDSKRRVTRSMTAAKRAKLSK